MRKSSFDFVIDGSFSDFDHFTETAKAWDLDFYQLEKGAFAGSLKQRGFAQAQLGEAKFSRSLEQHGASPQGLRTFVIQAPGVPPLKWRGYDTCQKDLLIFPGNAELYSLSQAGFHIFTYSIRESALAAAGERLGMPQIEDFLNSSVEVVTLSDTWWRRLLTAYRRVLHSEPDELLKAGEPDLLWTMEFHMASMLVEAIMESVPIQLPSPGSAVRAKAMRTAMELVNDCRQHPITVEMLCVETGVKARTLQYAFQECYGMSPKQWLKLRSLNKVKKDLRSSDPALSGVADIANKWGLWHMGQLAKDYRMTFGELPSETLGRAG
tara:strand:+ start:921 stop:1889 length:969 start_codon:yes stop_codon:yes gene_type:complete